MDNMQFFTQQLGEISDWATEIKADLLNGQRTDWSTVRQYMDELEKCVRNANKALDLLDT